MTHEQNFQANAAMEGLSAATAEAHDNYTVISSSGNTLNQEINRQHILEEYVDVIMNLYLIYKYFVGNKIDTTFAKQQLATNKQRISNVIHIIKRIKKSTFIPSIDLRPLLDQDISVAKKLAVLYDSVTLTTPERQTLELSFDMNDLVLTAKARRTLPNPLPNTHNPEIIARFSMVVTDGLLSNIIDNPDEYSLQLQDLADLLEYPNQYSGVQDTERIRSINNHLRVLNADMMKSPEDLASNCGLTGAAKNKYCRAIELLKSQTPRQPEPPIFTWPDNIDDLNQLIDSLFEGLGPSALEYIGAYAEQCKLAIQDAGFLPK